MLEAIPEFKHESLLLSKMASNQLLQASATTQGSLQMSYATSEVQSAVDRMVMVCQSLGRVWLWLQGSETLHFRYQSLGYQWNRVLTWYEPRSDEGESVWTIDLHECIKGVHRDFILRTMLILTSKIIRPEVSAMRALARNLSTKWFHSIIVTPYLAVLSVSQNFCLKGGFITDSCMK